MQRFIALKLIASALLCLGVPAAKADIVVVTWQGSIISGTDYNNTFGGGLNSDLSGKAYTATYKIDTTLGSLVTAPDYASLNGGTAFGAGNFTSPIASAILSVNGLDYGFASTLYGGYTRNATSGISQIYTEAQQQNGPAVSILYNQLFLFNSSVLFPGLNESLNLPITTGGAGYTQAFNSDASVWFFNANLNPTNVSIETLDPNTPTGPTVVPEPGTTAVLIFALGGVAAYARRRRS